MVGYGAIISEEMPQGQSGPAADAMAQEVLKAVNIEAWEQTGAVSWTFGPHKHLWDRTRNLAQVEWGETRVLLDLSTRKGIVYENGKRVEGEEADKTLETAWFFWVNDSFWLNAPAKLFDKGTSRSIVQTEEGPQLMVSYASGGATPGDAYLWKLNEDTGRPESWRMWVKIIPIGGFGSTWTDWEQLETGAWVSTMHQTGPLPRDLKPVKGAERLFDLTGGKDPFRPLSKL